VAKEARPDDVVVAADTLVVVDGVALGKPRDREETRRMLASLSGRKHQVVTGVALAKGAELISSRDVTTVVFAPISAAEIERYASSGEPHDRAGAYAIQGLGGLFVTGIEGSPSNVIGLPVRLLYELAGRFGVDLFG